MKSNKKGNAAATAATSGTAETQNSNPSPEATPPQDSGDVEERQRTFEQCEEVIRNGLGTPIETGRALRTIHDKELYKISSENSFTTFAEYCEKRWGISDKYAYHLMDYAIVVELLTTHYSTIGETAVLPANEAQARPLTRLKTDKHNLVIAWNKIKRKLKDGKTVTAATVEEAVKKVIGTGSDPKSESGTETMAAAPSKSATTVPSTKVQPVIKWIDEALKKEASLDTFRSVLEKVLKTLRKALNVPA